MEFKKTIEINLEITLQEMKKWIKSLSLEDRVKLFHIIKASLPGYLWDKSVEK